MSMTDPTTDEGLDNIGDSCPCKVARHLNTVRLTSSAPPNKATSVKEAALGNEMAAIGDRFQFDGHFGTIRFIGEVPPTEGMWYGVDWDDEKRGKHDGLKDGVRYFTTRCQKSGSFLRPKKANLGLSLMECVKERYGLIEDEHAGVNTDEMFVKGNNQHTVVELVGFKSVNLAQCQFNKLTEVVLRGLPVSFAGTVGSIASELPNVKRLDISATLLSNWIEISKITSQLPKLHMLSVSDNTIDLPKDLLLREADLGSIETLSINRFRLTWLQMLQLSLAMPRLHTLHSCFNEITTVPSFTDQLTNLSTLNLEGNTLESWADVLNLSSLVSLENLILNNTDVQSIEFNDVPAGGTTKYFPNLKSLSLYHNKISEWHSINELNKLAKFEDIKLQFNPLTEKSKHNVETLRNLIIAKINGVRFVNRSQVLTEERYGAELDYLRMFGKEWRKSGGHQDPVKNNPSEAFSILHPRYQACIEAHGASEDQEFVIKSSALKDNLLAVTIDCPQLPLKPPVKKKLPVTMTLQKVKALIQRVFKADPTTLKLTYTSKANPDQHFEMDNDLRVLEYFSLVEGDVIHVKF